MYFISPPKCYLPWVMISVMDSIPWVRCASGNVFFIPGQCRTLRVPWGQGGEVGKGSQPEDQKWWIYDDLMMTWWWFHDEVMIFLYGAGRRGRTIKDDGFVMAWLFDDAMIFWWWYRCEERYADVDVHPGEENREGGLERTVQLVWEQKCFL